MSHDLRFAARSLRRAPGFAVTATMTLALGIGLSTAVFTVSEALLIRRLPVTDQDRVVLLWGTTRDGSLANVPLLLSDAREFAHRTRSLESVAFYGFYGSGYKPIRDGDRVYRLRRALVSGGFFDVLGSKAILGRALRPSDDVVGADPVVVLSHRAWRGRFGGDSSVVGRTILLHDTGRPYRIIGVMPQGLDFPQGTEFWAPLVVSSTGSGDSLHITSPALDLIGRLRPENTLRHATAELTEFFGEMNVTWLRDARAVGHFLPQVVLGDTKPALFILATAAGILLLLACINVANLLLVRGLARTRELVVRSALGAGRARIVRQLLTESALLSLAGGMLGALLAVAAVQAFVAIAPPELPRLDEITVNRTVLAGAVGIVTVAMLLFSLAPAFVSSRVELQDALRSGTRQAGVGPRLRLATETLVVGQLVLAVVVLAAAGLILRSLARLQNVDLAFQPRQVLVAELAMRDDLFSDNRPQRALLDALLSRISALPEIESVTPVISVPFAGSAGGIDGRLATPMQTAEQLSGNPMLDMQIVTPNYFASLEIPVLRGRAFSDNDREGAPQVIVISQSTARYFWPNDDPLGKILGVGGSRPMSFTVVGVVADTRYRELRSPRPAVYFPLRQSFFPVTPMTLAMRTRGEPAQAASAVRRAVSEVDPAVAVASASPLESFLEQPRAQPRMNALLLSFFAIVAISLAAVGLFGVIATTVRQRTRELGIRMALGATQTNVRRLVMARGLTMAATGSVLGVAVALLAGRALSALLFEVSPTDAATLGVVGALVVVVGTLATFIPARATTRIDPAIALRSEV